MTENLYGHRGARDRLKTTFDTDAELYAVARPTYPADIFVDLLEFPGVPSRPKTVEIGCGTGQATVQLASRGCRVVCLEPGSNLCRVARRTLSKFPEVEVIQTSFETWRAERGPFDVAFAATSWHWLDPSVAYQKASDILSPSGVLAILDGSLHAFPDGFDTFFTDLQTTYTEIGMASGPWPPASPERVGDRREEIERTGHFKVEAVKRYLWAREYSAESYINLLRTYSDHIALPEQKQTRLYSTIRRLAAQRAIRKDYLSILHLCRKAR